MYNVGHRSVKNNNYLEGLYKCPEEDANGVSLPQQLDQTGGPEQAQKSNIEEVFLQTEYIYIYLRITFEVRLLCNICDITANSTMSASTMLPTTVMKSNVFHESRK